MTSVTLESHDLVFLCDLVYERSAIVLDAAKEYLLRARLEPVARDEGLTSIADLVDEIRRGGAQLADRVVDALTTNETSWFRDLRPFDALRDDVLPDLIERRRTDRRLTIWSAASSTGQELYSIAIVLREHFPELAGWDVSLLGTDISPTALARAKEGRYSQVEVNRGLPALLLARYFDRSGAGWRVKPDLQTAVTFRSINLAQKWFGVPPCDVVFLRNVLIYFDHETKARIFEQVNTTLRNDGYLFLGAAETPPRGSREWSRHSIDRSGCWKQV